MHEENAAATDEIDQGMALERKTFPEAEIHTMKELDVVHAKNEQTADPPDKIDAVVDDFLSGLARSVE